MVFSSHLFLYYFLPLSLALYYLAPRSLRHLLLTLLSYVFYGWSNPLFVPLLVFSTAVDYGCGLVIAGGRQGGPMPALDPDSERSPTQRLALLISILTNLSLLGFFKYFNFGIDSWNVLVEATGQPQLALATTLRVVLPLGISFYTFQSMSYTIDVYRGHARALQNPVDFACYVAMFPQLVAGPIIRFAEVAAQLQHRTHTIEKMARGVAMLCLGMAKKVLLANPMGKLADVTFGAGSVGAVDAWYGVTAYAFQIYFDFSGYSDMAIGLGLMFGFVFPKNFDSPYRSQSITEFWRRWHISLSSWLRDYLYVPLGGNRLGNRRTYINLALVMLLGGLWHGAAWTFVVWGAWHGLWLGFERAMGKTSAYGAWPAPLRTAITFIVVLISWVFFRAENLPRALDYLGHMFGAAPAAPAALLAGILYQPYYLLSFAAAGLVVWRAPQSWDLTRSIGPAKAALCVALMALALVAMATQDYNPFIYFIF